MAQLIENASLKEFNTFGLDVKARYFFRFDDKAELDVILKDKKLVSFRKFILGGGSNLLFLNDFDGIVIQPENKDITEIRREGKHVFLRTGAGLVWDNFVEFCCLNGFGGIENLSLIPGHTGASAVQNIGAFGVEAGDVISSVDIYNLTTGEDYSLKSQDCRFGYRESIFKNELKDNYLVTGVTYKLTHKDHSFNTSYGDLKKNLDELGETSIQTIRKTVIKIRESKLPDPKTTGNAGSFFKNPLIADALLKELQKTHPDVPVYPAKSGFSKVAAGWLIDKAGWKGKIIGNAGVHDKQALVLVNRGGATGKEIEFLANEIKQSVLDKFGIFLEPEVIFIK